MTYTPNLPVMLGSMLIGLAFWLAHIPWYAGVLLALGVMLLTMGMVRES